MRPFCMVVSVCGCVVGGVNPFTQLYGAGGVDRMAWDSSCVVWGVAAGMGDKTSKHSACGQELIPSVPLKAFCCDVCDL
jgi:hypothetical protein